MVSKEVRLEMCNLVGMMRMWGRIACGGVRCVL